MEVLAYEALKVTTITLVMSLKGWVNKEAAFHVLPVTRVPVQPTRESSKCRLPHCKTPGALLSIRYRNQVRGVIRSKKRPFKNALTLDVSTTVKNISVKLSSFSFQMCGASSREDGIEAATHVINHLKKAQRILNRMRADPQGTQAAIAWVKEQSRGPLIDRYQINVKACSNLNLNIITNHLEYSIVRPTGPIPEELDPEVVNFLIPMVDDFIYHPDMCLKLDYLPTLQALISDQLEISQVDESMRNYNYSLGFEVDRALLNEFIHQQNGFISRYNNALTTCVTVELPYEPPADSGIKRKKNKIPRHTFLVYRSGSITQSGPGGGGLMRDAYYLFMHTIAQLRDWIEYAPESQIEAITEKEVQSQLEATIDSEKENSISSTEHPWLTINSSEAILVQ